MASVLGIFVSSNVIKYAKISEESGKKLKLEDFGVRFVKGTQKETIRSIIEETNSQKIPIAINPQGSKYINYVMFDQAQGRNVMADVAKMEFEAWCEKNAKSPEKYSYIYKVAEVKNNENRYNAVLNFIEKSKLEECSDLGEYKADNILPAQFSINRLVPQDEKNYMLVNLDEALSICVIVEGKLLELKYYDIGMKQILDDFSLKLGSYQKAYEACKQLNVYSDESTNNNHELEQIAEPVLQEVLRNVAIVLSKNRNEIEKVYITGNGIVFTNMDILFKEYLNIKCEILKPEFIQDTSDVRNVAEMLETVQAMALAVETISPVKENLTFSPKDAKSKSMFASSAKPRKLPKREKSSEDRKEKELNLPRKIYDALVCSSIVMILVVIAYSIFGIMYSNNINTMIKKIDQKTNEITTAKSEIDSDITYILNNTAKYKVVNDQVNDYINNTTTSQVRSKNIYNVAAFMQRIVKIIPNNVQLKSIKSDENKHVTISAQSESYSSLGYFLSELKLSGTLNNIEVNTVQNGTTTVVEIGGDLP